MLFYTFVKKKKVSKTFRNILFAVGIIIIILILWYFKNIVAYILISAILALVGRPVVDVLGKIRVKSFRLPKALRAVIALLLIWVLMFTFFRVFIPILVNETNALAKMNVENISANLKEPIAAVEDFITRYSVKNNFSLDDYITEKLASFISFSSLTDIFGSIAGFLGNIFIAIFSISFITFFFLKDEKLFGEGILLFVPSEHEVAVKHAMSSARNLLMRYFIGIGGQITGIILLVTIGLTIIGIGFQHALIIGLFAGLFNIIPYVGPIIGTLFGIFLGIVTHLELDFYTGILPLTGYMLLVFVIVQLIDNFLFQPLIYSSSVKAHPLEVFLVILIAGSLAGIPGMILAIPSYTIIRVFAKEFFNNFKVVKKLTEKI